MSPSSLNSTGNKKATTSDRQVRNETTVEHVQERTLSIESLYKRTLPQIRNDKPRGRGVTSLIGCVALLLCMSTVSAVPTFSDFTSESRRVFRDVNNPNAFYHSLSLDSKNSSRLFVGALDFVYGLNVDNIENSPQVSGNITISANYTATYTNNVGNCWLLNSLPNKAIQCRNHVRAVFSLASGDVYLCATGAFNPQEFYLNSDLQLTRVEQRSRSGYLKCPFDPVATYSAILSASGNPLNSSMVYTLVSTDSTSSSVTIVRSPVPKDRFSNAPVGAKVLQVQRDSTTLNTQKDVLPAGIIEVNGYVYYFFRELAFESSWLCSQTYFSRVARVCKDDMGLSSSLSSFIIATFLKARLICSATDSSESIPFFFNEVYDVTYNATSQQFYALFLTNGNAQWGSAVCQYSLADIDKVFNTGSWVERLDPSSAWTITPSTSVPRNRPGQCVGPSFVYDTVTESFIKTHPLMKDYVNPVGGNNQPLYYSKQLAFQKLEVDFVGEFVVLYLYDPGVAELHRVSVFSDSYGGIQSNLISIWKPFHEISPTLPVKVWNTLTVRVNQTTWLYMTTDFAVVQLKTEQCSSYQLCTECAVDPYCGWNSSSSSCMKYRPGLIKAINASDALSVCQPSCTEYYQQRNVIPGKSLHLVCSSLCFSDGNVTWYYQSDNDSVQEVPIDSDNNYLVTRESGLVILEVNRTQHTGIFQCQLNGVILTQHTVSMSVCELGDAVRDTWLNEFTKYCKEFDNYKQEYEKWRCMQNHCIKTNCSSFAQQCGLT